MGNNLEVTDFVFWSAKQTTVHGKQIMKKKGLLGYLLRRWTWHEGKEAKLAGPHIRDRPVLDLAVGPCEKGLKISKTGLDWPKWDM